MESETQTWLIVSADNIHGMTAIVCSKEEEAQHVHVSAYVLYREAIL